METDYLTVFKDLLVKGDFELEGGGSQTFDTIIDGSFKLTGIAGLGTSPPTTHAVTVMAAGTAPARKGLQIQVPTGFKGHYLEILKGSNIASVRFAVGTTYTKNYGSFYAQSGSFVRVVADSMSAGSVAYAVGSFQRVVVASGGITTLGPTLGSFGSFTRLAGAGGTFGSYTRVSVDGPLRGSYGSFTRLAGVSMGTFGSYTRISVDGPLRGSYGSFTRYGGLGGGAGTVSVSLGSFRTLVAGSVTRLYGTLGVRDRLGSYSMVVSTGSAQGRVGVGRWVVPGSAVNAFHAFSRGAELALKQAYGQTSRLWVDRAVLNVSEANFGSPFAAAIVARTPISGSAGVNKHAILLMSGTRAPQAGYMKAQQMPGSLTVFEIGSARGNLGIGTTQQPGRQIYAVGTARMNRFVGTPYFNRAKGTYQAAQLLGTTVLNRARGTAYFNRAKGTFQAPRLLGTTVLNRAMGTAYFNRAKGTFQATKLLGTTLFHKTASNVTFANANLHIFTGGGIGTYMIAGEGYGVRMKSGYMLTVGTLGANVTPYQRGHGDLVVLGTARVTKGLILGTQLDPRGYKLLSEGSASVNRFAGTPYFNRARGTFMGKFLGSFRQKVDLRFVGYGVGATKTTTAIINNAIFEEFTVGDEVFLQGHMPHDWVGTPAQLELDIIPTATEAGSVTSKWYAITSRYSVEDGVAQTYGSKGDHIRMPGSAYKMRDIKIPLGSSTTDISLLKNKEYFSLRVKRVAATLGTQVTAAPGLVHAELVYWANRLRPGTYYAY